MIYFPYPYEDELMYSVFCRYYVHSGCFSHKMALGEILVNRHCNPSKEFLGNLKPEIKEQLQRIQPIEDWVLTHTMMPQYARFIPLERKKSALYHLCHYYKDAHQLFSILPRAESDRYLKYCPMCVDEDREQYGECYWHRIHQIRNIQVCPKHQCMLENSIVTAKSEQAFTFSPAEQYVTSIVPKVMLSSQFTEFSRYMTNVFSAQLDFKSDIPISAVLYNAMLNSKYMKASGQYRNTKQLADDMKKYYTRIGVANISSFYQIQRVLHRRK